MSRDWFDDSARAVVWWLLSAQGVNLAMLAKWEQVELKELRAQVKALGVKP